jgi:Uncharacterized protein conserved in bacteria (DUF2330)
MQVRLVSFLILLLCMGPAAGDGKYVSRSRLKPVEIPRQMAALSHAEGWETLTIWNTVKAADEELAWVLPLPAAPEVIQETPAAAFRVLQMACAPAVNVDEGFGSAALGVWVASIFAACFGVSLLLARRPSKGLCHPWERLLVAVGLGVTSMVLFVSGGRIMAPRSTPTAAGVEVLEEGQVGNYETTVVRGDSPAELSAWLNSHGFSALDEVGGKAVGEYVAEGWVFLCAKLKKGIAGAAGTHPLTVRFPSPELVYPMRLTQGSGTVPVDLFVLGGNWVADPSGRVAQVMTVEDGRRSGPSAAYPTLREIRDVIGEGRVEGETARRFVPAGRDLLLDALVANGSCLTHLQGIFTVGSDWSDLKFVTGTEKQEPLNLVTREHLSGHFRSLLAPVGSGVLLFMSFLARVRAPRGKKPAQRQLLLFPVLLAVVFATMWGKFYNNRVFVEPAQVVKSSRGAGSFSKSVKDWLDALTVGTKSEGRQFD